MSEPRELPRKIVVAGDGQLGVLAAIALKRALPSSDVMVVGLRPDAAALCDSMPTALPFTNKLHDRLGIEEARLVREAGASHRLVVRYRGWGGAAHESVAPYGAAIDPKLKTGFARDWGGGPRNASTTAPPGSLAEALAAEGRFEAPSGAEDSLLADVDYALRWNVPAYRALLVEEAQKIGIEYRQGAIASAQPNGEGGIASIAVDGVGPVEADMFVDCTGPRALLLAQVQGAEWARWNGHLPIHALLLGRPAEPVLALEDRIELVPEGWLSHLAGRDGRYSVLAVVEGVSEQAAVAALPSDPLGFVPLDQGRAKQPWIGNVVALGDAAAHFEPLGWLNLDLAHRQLALLLELLPGRRPDPRERAEFNRRATLMADRVLDLLGAHYAAPAAFHFGLLNRSDELELVLDQYTRRGRLPFLEEAPLLVQEHSALLHALGHQAGEGALAAAADRREAEAGRAAFAAKAQAALRVTPPYGAWLSEVVRS